MSRNAHNNKNGEFDKFNNNNSNKTTTTQPRWVGVPMVHVKAAQHTFFSCRFGFWLIWAAISDISYRQEKENTKKMINEYKAEKLS